MTSKTNSEVEIREIDDAYLRGLSNEELIGKVKKLQAHILQLKNIIKKTNHDYTQKTRPKREFDFSSCKKLHVMLKLLYFGWDYQGYVVQENSTTTIEHELFKALLSCKLIESRESSNYHRCGRTDKGVSSFSQVISISLRAANEGKPPLDYCKMLNRLLPEEIRVIGWSPVEPAFSARFDCISRTYRYFFPKGNLNLQAMDEGSKYLIGTHDFRNFCKMDVANGVLSFIRRIDSANVKLVNSKNSLGEGYQICELRIAGSSFLWHQIRCIMTILIFVGHGFEKPDIIKDLLDINKTPRKPQYPLAHWIGLNLFCCDFQNKNWIEDSENISKVVETLQKTWAFNAMKVAQIESMLDVLEKKITEPKTEQTSFLLRKESRLYKPLLKRDTCSSLEERIEHYAKRKKTDSTVT